MASITFAIPDEIKTEMKELSWVNWSELAREEILNDLKKSKDLEKFLKIVSKSKFTKKDADILSKKTKESMHKNLKEKNLI